MSIGSGVWKRGRWGLVPVLGIVAGSLTAGPTDVEGQLFGPRHRYHVGIEFLAADPVGEFETFVEDGWGLGLHGLALVDPAGVVGIRADLGFVEYGRDRQPACVDTPFGCRRTDDFVTTNNIFYFDVGPEIGVNIGGLRPYMGVGAGLSYFATTSSFGDYDPYDFTEFSDVVWAWRARGGLKARISNSVYVDVSAVYHENGLAEYLTEGGIEDNPDGSTTYYPIYGEANLVTFQVGVSFGFGGGHDDRHDDWDRRRRKPGRHWD